VIRAVLLVFVFSVSLAHGDVLYAKQGGRPIVSGVKVVDRSGGKVTYLDKALKKRSFPDSMIGRVEVRRCDIDVYQDRFAKAEDAPAVMALAAWAHEKGFHKEVIHALHERALDLDPENEAANLALGRVRYDGAWMTPAQRDARKAEEEAAVMRAKGLVRYKDEWVTPEDKRNLEKGLRKYKGRWMTEEQIKAEQGFVKYEGRWVKKDTLEVLRLTDRAKKETGLGDRLHLVQSDHYAVLGDLAEAQLATLDKTMERLFAEWVRLFPDAAQSDILEGKHRLYAFRKNGPYRKLIRVRFDRQKAEEGWSAAFLKSEQRRMKLRMRETSFWDVQPRIVSAHVLMPDPFEGLKAHCVHFGANILATRYERLRFPTWWLNEGIAYYFEKKVAGAIQTYSADTGGAGRYADQGPVAADQANPWLDASKWNDLLLGLVRGGRDPKLDRMKTKNLFEAKNRLTAKDLAKSLSVVTFLIRDDPKTFAAFFRDAKLGGSRDPVEREVSAVLKHYSSYAKIEQRWRAYALNGFHLVR